MRPPIVRRFVETIRNTEILIAYLAVCIGAVVTEACAIQRDQFFINRAGYRLSGDRKRLLRKMNI